MVTIRYCHYDGAMWVTLHFRSVPAAAAYVDNLLADCPSVTIVRSA
jgi:hypothetical protein